MNHVEDLLNEDGRCQALRTGLEQLDDADLRRLRDHLDGSQPLVLDAANFDPATATWCPLAVALGLHEEAGPLPVDDRAAKEVILAEGRRKYGAFSLNPLSGTDGVFFRQNRYEDLRALVTYLVSQRP